MRVNPSEDLDQLGLWAGEQVAARAIHHLSGSGPFRGVGRDHEAVLLGEGVRHNSAVALTERATYDADLLVVAVRALHARDASDEDQPDT